jgi:hypothetical protein
VSHDTIRYYVRDSEVSHCPTQLSYGIFAQVRVHIRGGGTASVSQSGKTAGQRGVPLSLLIESPSVGHGDGRLSIRARSMGRTP